MRNHPTITTLGLGLLLAGAVQAQTHTVYVGGLHIDVNSKAPALQGGTALPPPGAMIDVGDADSLGFGYVYRFNPTWSVEAAVGLPPKHKVYGRGFIEPFGQILSVKQVAPTAFVNYHFDALFGGRLVPFVGAGINFTRFTDIRSTPSGNAASGGPTSTTLKDSLGLAVHAGITVPLGGRWSFVATVAHADVQTDSTATTRTNSGDIVRTTHITFRPTAGSASLGYSF